MIRLGKSDHCPQIEIKKNCTKSHDIFMHFFILKEKIDLIFLVSFLFTIPVRYYFTFIKVIVDENGLFYRNNLLW